VGDVASVQVTRFDQTARGLLQRVTAMGGGPGHGSRSSHGYRFQNVGAIGNRGWELSGSLRQGPFSLGAALSLVDSRVLRLADGYTGDLREGDRPLEVPARTLGLTASWDSRGWMASLTANRATDWINYDRLALARDLASSSGAPGDLTGERLRSYWRPYDGLTHLNALVSRDLFGRFTLTVAGENLLGHQLGEPDNITVLPGRTLRVGLRASF
jgi:iron complex outermembrane receptor protein